MRRLIITNRNYFGLCSERGKERDLICILYGCSVPVVLREHRDPESTKIHFEFIGECYVHDLMDGEAFIIQSREKLARQKQEERRKQRQREWEQREKEREQRERERLEREPNSDQSSDTYIENTYVPFELDDKTKDDVITSTNTIFELR